MAMLNPATWGWERLRLTAANVGADHPDAYWPDVARRREIRVAKIGLEDIRAALTLGAKDFGANRTDIPALCVIYPVVGLFLARMASGAGALPLIFPLASGFALLGPIAALGLYELSRRREHGMPAAWTDMFKVLRSPAIVQITILAVLLACIFGLWLAAAGVIYDLTLGPLPPASLSAFTSDVLTTGAGWAMIIIGVGVGFLFAVLAMTISVVAFPLMLDRYVSLDTAVRTSFMAVKANLGMMAVWGAIVALGLVVGSIPVLLGLAVVLPILGHATWHLYERLVK